MWAALTKAIQHPPPRPSGNPSPVTQPGFSIREVQS